MSKEFSRRDFLKLSGLSFVSAVLAHCNVPVTPPAPPKTPESTGAAPLPTNKPATAQPAASETVIAPSPAEVKEQEIV